MSSGQKFVRESHKAGLVVVNLGLNAKPSGSGEPEVSNQRWLVAVKRLRRALPRHARDAFVVGCLLGRGGS